MNDNILQHYLGFSLYTNPGLYRDFLRGLPDDIRELGNLVCRQVIHRVTLRQGNTGANVDRRYGDMDDFPWHRLRCEDDILMTAVSMIAELLRLDGKGFTRERTVEDKIVVTCRYVAVLMASILKSKGIPCRCRSGFAPYLTPTQSVDHWVAEYWDDGQSRWVALDADGLFDGLDFDQFDIPRDRFDWAAESWLKIRRGQTNGDRFVYAGGLKGIEAAVRAVIYDFHSLMNDEISYRFMPKYLDGKVSDLSEPELAEIDDLAELMTDPDEHFHELKDVWDNTRKFRIMNAPLIGDADHP